VRGDARAGPAIDLVNPGNHRRFQFQQVFRDLRRKGGPVTTTSVEAGGRTIEAGGIVTHYHDAGSGKPVLLLHGSGPRGAAWANWQHNIPVLAERYRVIAPDIVGFGDTERPDDVHYSLGTWIDHVWAFLDALGIEETS